jgi:hypothetical protein
MQQALILHAALMDMDPGLQLDCSKHLLNIMEEN